MTIYLLKDDDSDESVLLNFYCISERTIIEAIKHSLVSDTKNFNVYFKEEFVTYEIENCFGEWQSKTTYFKTIKQFKK